MNPKHIYNQVRIIGGKWRSRKISFPDMLSLRPTPDRVRETLFNWLSNDIIGAHCLDMFSGSGALGFEALSREAASVVMVDESLQVIQSLKQNAACLNAESQITFCSAKAPSHLIPVDKKYEIVFLDPPFHQNYLPLCFQWLEQSHCLKENALIYIEMEPSIEVQTLLPQNVELIRQKQSGQVQYCLVISHN